MLEIKKEQCDQCLFSKNRIVNAARMKEIISSCVRNDNHFECHKGTLDGKNIVCAGWYSRYTSQMIRIAGRLNVIKFV
jgi:hypothetical protein